MKLRTVLVAATILAAPAAAIAQPVTGPYVDLGLGANIFNSQKIKNVAVPAGGQFSGNFGKIETDADIIGSGAVGWGFGNGFRLEVEGDYLQNALRSFHGIHASGQEEEYGGFVNGLYDFDLSPWGLTGVSPFVGVGVGYSEATFGSASAYNGGPTYTVGGNAGSVGVQGIAGVAFNIPDVPGLAITAEYRFIAMPENLKFHASVNGRSVGITTESLLTNAGLVGLRYALWQPAPPPPPPPAPPAPPPAPEAARTYLVFFDWDRADLSARARQIVAEAAQASTHVQTTRIEVNGYTDLSGTAAYNLKLSVRRAKSVEAELIKDGVAQNEIAIHGYGEENPLVPTAQGVREPQNRRVEIILK
jgi:outer membrane protein OmpA-like peptidoglycan-associated protein